MNISQLVDLPTRKLARIASQLPAPGLFWCGHCDASIIGHGAKCKHCGIKHKTKKSKKAF